MSEMTDQSTIGQIHSFESYASALQELEHELNLAKDKLDRTDFNELKSKDRWEQTIFQLRRTVRNTYGGQGVTKAWLKMYEILNIPKVNSRLLAEDRIIGFFNADLPGAFVLATNHFAKTHNKPFGWVISSYLPKSEQADFLPDSFGIIQSNPESSLVGIINTNRGQFYSDGDLTNPKMPKILSHLAKTKLGSINLYTADGGFGVEGQENLQEKLSIPLIMGEIETGLRSLSLGGIFVLKMFTFFTPEMLTSIAQLVQLFEDYQLYKPSTSNPMNSEIYFIGIGYLGASDDIINKFNSGIIGETTVLTSAVTPKIRDQILTKLQIQVRKQIEQINQFILGQPLDMGHLDNLLSNLQSLPESDQIRM